MDPRLARMFDEYRTSELYRSERALAHDADAPDGEDVVALARGQIRAPWRREALARHLIAGEDSLERALPALALHDAGHDEILAPPNSWRGFVVFAAAAAILVSAFGLGGLMSGSGLALDVRLTDHTGQEMRSPTTYGAHRMVVAASKPAYAALARVTNGAIVVESIDGSALTTQLAADEETLLPLDRAITPLGAERWLVLLSRSPFDGMLADLFARAARGDVPEGCVLRELVVGSN